MKKSTLALLALGMFGVGSMASVGLQAFAQTPVTPAVSTPAQSAPVETSNGPDTDNIQDEVGDKGPESAQEAQETEGVESGVDADGPGGHQDETIETGGQKSSAAK